MERDGIVRPTVKSCRYRVGEQVRIAPKAMLEEFLQTWKLHNQLKPEQVVYADQVRTIKNVGFYHGGDAMHELDGLPGFVWHETCLLCP